MLRKDLAKSFPGTKFSVTKSPGGSIRVKWTDGPTTKQVEKVSGVYEGKGFDGSIDMSYHYKHYVLDGRLHCAGTTGTEGSMGYVPNQVVTLPPGAEEVSVCNSYVMEDRTFSKSAILAAIAAMEGIINPEDWKIETHVWDGKESYSVEFSAGEDTRSRGFVDYRLRELYWQQVSSMAF